MAITGSLEEASLPDVLQLLSIARKTGCLSLTDRLQLGRIYVEDGQVTYASVVNRPDRLGDLLVKNGTLTPVQLGEAISRQSRHRDRKLGEVLLELGWICRADLEQAVRRQIEEAVYALLGWTRGRFSFQSGVYPENQDVTARLSAEALMLEGARRIDEWSVIARKVPSFNLVFQLVPERLEASSAELTEVQTDLVDRLDGERDLRQIVEETGHPEFDVAKAVYGLVTAGFVRSVGRSDGARRSGAAADRHVEHKNLGTAFYRAGMYEEAQREFQHVVEFHVSDVESHFYLGLLAFKMLRWLDAVRHFEHAAKVGGPSAAILHNLALCYERVGRLQEAESTAAQAVAAAPDDGRVLIGWGIVALTRGDGAAAAARLDRARLVLGEGPVGSLWFWARSLAAARTGDLQAAERLLRQGLEQHARHPVLRNNLAVLLELEGEVARAERLLLSTLEDDPSVPEVSKNLGDLAYRMARYDDAWEAYQRAIRLRPQLGDDTYFKLGNIAVKRSHPELARQFWCKALELNPGHRQARVNLDALDAQAATALATGQA